MRPESRQDFWGAFVDSRNPNFLLQFVAKVLSDVFKRYLLDFSGVYRCKVFRRNQAVAVRSGVQAFKFEISGPYFKTAGPEGVLSLSGPAVYCSLCTLRASV